MYIVKHVKGCADMKTDTVEARKCPKCGKTYFERPAISRMDNKTPICPDCGTREALESLGVGLEEQERILETIHRYQHC